MAEAEPNIEMTRSELVAALEKWDVDANSNGWKERTDKERFADGADYLIHTIRLARGEDGLPKEA